VAERQFKARIVGLEKVNLWLKRWQPRNNVKETMLLQVRALMAKVIGIQFSRLRRGGSARGVTWPPFKEQYTRKIDGAVVPAWGGVSRVRPAWKPPGEKRGPVRGNVLGKKRPSGRRMARGANLMQDTGTLRAQRAQLQSLTAAGIRFGPTVVYAARQNAMRPFSYFEIPKDAVASRRVAFKTFQDMMKRQ